MSRLLVRRGGPNFTTEGVLEGDVKIGDGFRVGSAEFRVTQPRMPCYKLGVRVDRDDMVKRFLRSGRTGFYLAVLREGELARGDSIEFTDRSDHNVTVADIVALYGHDADNQSLLRRAVELPALPDSWREYFPEAPVAARCLTARSTSSPTKRSSELPPADAAGSRSP